MQSGSFKIKFLLVFICLNIGFSVCAQEEAEQIYNILDRVLANPTIEKQTELKTIIKQTKSETRPVLLAKTIAYCNLGYLEAQSYDYNSAIKSYEKAKYIYLNNGIEGYDIIEYCLKPLGNIYIKNQAFTEAESIIKQYILLAGSSHHRKQKLAGYINLSTLYLAEGKFNKAQNTAQSGLKVEPENEKLKINLAKSYFALSAFDKAESIIQVLIPTENSSVYQLKAQIEVQHKNYSQAIKSLKKALQLQRKARPNHGREEAKIQLALAETYRLQQHFKASLQAIKQVYNLLIPSFKSQQTLPNHTQIYPENTIMDALDLQGNIFAQNDQHQEALKAYQLAQEIDDMIFYGLLTQDNKYAVQSHIKQRSEHILDILFTLYKTSKNPKWLNTALKTDSKVKGRIANEAAQLKSTLYKENPAQSIRLQNIQKQLAVINKTIHDYIKKDHYYEKIPSLQVEYDRLLTSARLLQDSLQERFLMTSDKLPELSLEKLQKKTKENEETIISYFVGNSSVYQFIISGNQSEFNRLIKHKTAVADFKNHISAYLHLFDTPSAINNNMQAFQDQSYELFKKLHITPAKNLIIIPDGLLSLLPFQTLLTKTSTSRDFEKLPYLIYKSQISHLLSLRDYLNKTERLSRKATVLGVFPIFKDSSQELFFSQDEARSLRRYFPGTNLMGEEATGSNFLKVKQEYPILHISSHALGGSFQDDAFVSFIEQPLSVNTLYNTYTPSDLVVLSACETGIGKVIRGEGALSLARGFQMSGAKSILFSLWEVNDKSTADWMHFFYRDLSKTNSRNRAAAKAGLDYLRDKNIGNIRKSPYYWGAFVYYGPTEKATKHHNIWWEILSVLALFIIAESLLLFIAKRKNSSRYQ